MNKSKILTYIMIFISIILCFPSIVYLINYKTVDGFEGYHTYTLEPWTNKETGALNGIIVIGLFLIISTIYVAIMEKEKNIFKNKKQILILIMIISFLFMLILPYLSSDVYYYIGDSWLEAKYGENPYYTSVGDLQEIGINDEILNNTGYWKDTTSIYGPIWNIIARLLVSASLGSVTIALFIFKIMAYLIHIINSYLMYKITKSNKCMILYGLNPLVLIEFLSNVHNDVYLVLFILLALYFLIRKKNIVLTIIFLAVSIGIKYSTILLVPFILIYCFRKQNIWKRILYCIVSGISIIALVILFYMPYYKDISIFTNMLIQGHKYNQSLLLLLILKLEPTLFYKIKALVIPVFIAIYIIVLISIVFKRKVNFKDIIRKYNILMLIFIFGVLATFQKWYILWLLPTIIWQSKNMKKYILYLTIVALIPSVRYFIWGTDLYIYGFTYSIDMLQISILAFCIDTIIERLYEKNKKFKKEKKCQI